ALLGRGEDTHRPRRLARRGQHRRALPEGRHRPEPLLPLVQGVPRGRQEAAGRRHRARGDGRGSHDAPRRSPPARRCAGPSHPPGPPAKKESERGRGRRRMRYAASETREIIRTVETSHLPVRRTLDKVAIPKTTFYAWLDRYAAGGFDALEDRKPRPKRVWNRI